MKSHAFKLYGFSPRMIPEEILRLKMEQIQDFVFDKKKTPILSDQFAESLKLRINKM